MTGLMDFIDVRMTRDWQIAGDSRGRPGHLIEGSKSS